MQGYNLFDFINWLLLLLITVWPALMLTVLIFFCICCAPCMIKVYKDYMQQRNAEQNERNGVIDKMVNRKFNADDFKEHTECSICKCDF